MPQDARLRTALENSGNVGWRGTGWDGSQRASAAAAWAVAWSSQLMVAGRLVAQDAGSRSWR